MWPSLQETADLVTLTKEILNEKLLFLCRKEYDFSLDKKKQQMWSKCSRKWLQKWIFHFLGKLCLRYFLAKQHIFKSFTTAKSITAGSILKNVLQNSYSETCWILVFYEKWYPTKHNVCGATIKRCYLSPVSKYEILCSNVRSSHQRFS